MATPDPTLVDFRDGDRFVQYLQALNTAITAGGASPATTVTGPDAFGASAVVGTDTKYARSDHDHGLPASPAGGGLLAVVCYKPGSYAHPNLSTSAVSPIDNTNLTIPFTTAASGKGSTQVLARVSGYLTTTAADDPVMGFALHAGGNALGSLFNVGQVAGGAAAFTGAVVIGSLTAATPYQFDLVGMANSTCTLQMVGQTTGTSGAGPCTLEIWAA
jgi:hypothetical protein